MKSFIFQAAVTALVASFSCTSALFWNGFRITSGTDLSIAFQPLARTVQEVEVANWTLDARENCSSGRFKGLRYVQPGDDSVALLFDVNGIIAGIQAQIPHSDIIKPENTFRFERVPMFQNITIRGEDFFVLTAYFVDPSTICTDGRQEEDLINEGTGTGLWYQNGDSTDDLIAVPKDRQAGLDLGWSKNLCWRAMGNHNFWQTELYESHQCNEIQPTFNLFDESDDQLLGFGFTIPGAVSLPRYEAPPNAVIGAIINPTPPCLTAMNDRVGAATLHIYFIEEPWLIACAGGH